MIQIVWYAIYSGHRDNKQQNSMDHNLHVCEWKHNISAAGLRIHPVHFDLRAFGMCTMYFLGFNMHNWSIADDHCVVEICIKNYYYLLLTLDNFFFSWIIVWSILFMYLCYCFHWIFRVDSMKSISPTQPVQLSTSSNDNNNNKIEPHKNADLRTRKTKSNVIFRYQM